MTDFLGNGILRPFARDQKQDFANGSGAELVGRSIGQVLGTRATGPTSQGELPWRPGFGSLLYQLRHENNTVLLRETARVFARDALRRWEPRAEILAIDIVEPETVTALNRVTLKVRWRPIGQNVPGNEVTTDISVPV